MEFKQVLETRCSCRKYTEQPVEREKLIALVEAGRISPSGCNTQRWMFIIVDDAEKKAKLSEALAVPELKVNTFTRFVPAYIVVVKEKREIHPNSIAIMGSPDYLWDTDIGIASENICLAATDMGLGSVMMGRFEADIIKDALDIPSDMDIGLVIGIGYPLSTEPRPKARRDLSDVMRINSFNGKA